MPQLIPLGFFSTPLSDYTWRMENAPSLRYNGGTYADLANGKFFGFGKTTSNATTTSYAYSNNGDTWFTGTLPSARRWGQAASNGTRLVAITSEDLQTAAAFTDNGTTWTAITLPRSAPWTDIIWDGTRFLATCDSTSSGNLSHSTDGSSFTGIDIGDGFFTIGHDGASRYIAGRGSTTTRTTTSNPTNAANWSSITMPAAGNWVSFVFGNGIWVAFLVPLSGDGGTTTYATSTNGTTWTSRTLPARFTRGSGTSGDAARGLFFEGAFYYSSPNILSGDSVTNTALFKSLDGINWETTQDFGAVTLGSVNGWAAIAGTIVGFGAAASGNQAILGTK